MSRRVSCGPIPEWLECKEEMKNKNSNSTLIYPNTNCSESNKYNKILKKNNNNCDIFENIKWDLNINKMPLINKRLLTNAWFNCIYDNGYTIKLNKQLNEYYLEMIKIKSKNINLFLKSENIFNIRISRDYKVFKCQSLIIIILK